MQRIFISSVQKEFAEERRVLSEYLSGDPLFRRFFETFLFEYNVPASDRRPDEVYLEEVAHSDLYVGLFGNEYGRENAEGLSPTHLEFNEATRLGKPRLIFVKGNTDDEKQPKMHALIQDAGSQLVRRRFINGADLIGSVYASLVEHLEKSVISTKCLGTLGQPETPLWTIWTLIASPASCAALTTPATFH